MKNENKHLHYIGLYSRVRAYMGNVQFGGIENMAFVVVELQTYTDGTVGNIVTAFTDRGQAEQKYHTILAAAAVSELPKHAAVLLSNDGHSLMYQCYRHETETAAEATADAEIEF